MTHDLNDQELRGEFAKLREEVSGSTPSFSAMAKPRRQARADYTVWSRRWAPATLVVATVLAIVVVYSLKLNQARPPLDLGLASVAWVGPTDFLLDTPGRALLESVPAIGVDSIWMSRPDEQNPEDTRR